MKHELTPDMQRIRDEIDAERHVREAERLASEPSNGARSHDGRRRIGGIREIHVPRGVMGKMKVRR